MSKLLEQDADASPRRVLTPGSPPAQISYEGGRPNIVRFEDGSAVLAACIGCEDRPCYNYRESELPEPPLDGFPEDKTTQVCPTDVVEPFGPDGLPVISTEGCIMCGVCVARCPVGAIFIDPGKGAVVAKETNTRFTEADPGSENQIAQTRNVFRLVKRLGVMVNETDLLVAKIGRRSDDALEANARYPNLLVRNLLRTLGVNAAMRRVGVTSMRMDILLHTKEGDRGVVEVEFGDEAVLDVPRDILDDVAVLVARHRWARGRFLTAIVTDILPNRRSEYWRIVADIQGVTQVRVLTMSIIALMLCVWRRMEVTSSTMQLFFADHDTKSYLADVIARVLGSVPKLTPASNRFVESIK